MNVMPLPPEASLRTGHAGPLDHDPDVSTADLRGGERASGVQLKLAIPTVVSAAGAVSRGAL